MKSMKLASNIRIENRKARFEYIILDRYTAGIQLFGTEIKSIREGKASLVDSWCQVVNGELFIKQMHIAEYRFGSYANHEAKRDRKLLLHRKEIRKLARATQDTGKTIVPLLLYINEKGLAKVEIALCQGKRTYDKRQSLREADDKREVAQAMKAARLK
jgi:SsrA-binding protein